MKVFARLAAGIGLLGLIGTLPAEPVCSISTETAAELVRAALDGTKERPTKLPGFRLELMERPLDSTFYFFEVTWSSPTWASPLVGSYAVDPKTGDVWDGIVCRQFKGSKLEELQRAARRKIGLTDGEYRKLRRHGPMC